MLHELEDGNEKEKQLDPRVESLAVPIARDYAEKNYQKIGEDENGDSIFEPAWRGVGGEKDLKGKSPEEVAAGLVAEGWTTEAAEAQAKTMVIDIANTSYDEYSDYWKGQNRGAAEFLVGLMDERGVDALAYADVSDAVVRSEYGTLIHDNWLSRNEWVNDPDYGNPDQAKPFDDLSNEEAQKDIDQLSVLKDWIAKNYVVVFDKDAAMDLYYGSPEQYPGGAYAYSVDKAALNSGEYVRRGGFGRVERVLRSKVPADNIVSNQNK